MSCTKAEIIFESSCEETLIVSELGDQFSFSDGSADRTVYIDKDDVLQLVEFLLAMKGE